MLLSFPEALLTGINFYYLYTVYVLGHWACMRLRMLGRRSASALLINHCLLRKPQLFIGCSLSRQLHLCLSLKTLLRINTCVCAHLPVSGQNIGASPAMSYERCPYTCTRTFSHFSRNTFLSGLHERFSPTSVRL